MLVCNSDLLEGGFHVLNYSYFRRFWLQPIQVLHFLDSYLQLVHFIACTSALVRPSCQFCAMFLLSPAIH